ARLTYPTPRRFDVSSMCSIWSTKICFVTSSSRPISVALPSSTEPHVTMRRRSVASARSEIADTLAVLHRCFGETVVGAGLAALGDAGRRDLVDDRLDGGRVGDDAARARHVAHGAEAHLRRERLLLRQALDEVGARIEHAVAPEHLPLVREVDQRQLELLARHVLPHVELRPVRDREGSDMLAL